MSNPAASLSHRQTPQPELHGPRTLLARRDFRRAFVADAISGLGNSFQFVAMMWLAVDAGGALGVLAVRLCGSLPALVFSLHGGVMADRWDRRRTMIAADCLRGVPLRMRRSA